MRQATVDRLKPCFVKIDDLDGLIRERMFGLMSKHFDHVSRKQFESDLQEKNEVLLLCDEEGSIQGFSTLKYWKDCFENEPIQVLFSGDTIIDKRHWGTQALAFSWIERAGQIKRQLPERRLFWFLIVKGHRTYRYLPAFALDFYPDWRAPEKTWLKRLADHLASEKFGPLYNPNRGILSFDSRIGQLAPDLSEPRPSDLERPDVSYFLKCNPGYRNGDELVCLCELSQENLRPIAKRVFNHGQ